jgi:hypothetical protein
MQTPTTTRDEAVARLQRSGFVAFKRDWALGETVGAATAMYREGEIICYPDMLYLCPVKDGWRVDELDGPIDETIYASLNDAVAAAELCLQRKKAAKRPASA